MRQSIKGVLLSGLVFPGLGQLLLQRVARGLAFAAVAIGCVIYLVKTTVDAVLRNLDVVDTLDIAKLTAAIDVKTGPVVWILLLCWILAAVDAYRIGEQLDRMGTK